MNGYIAWYRGRRTEVYAGTSLQAQEQAARYFRARKQSEVHVMLAEADGVPVTHRAVD